MRIKIRLGYDKELDGYDPGEVIAITFAEAKLNSIQNRGGTLSNRFGLAKTANNKRVLGVLDEVRNQDDKPYQRHDCTIEVDGLQVFFGFALIEESSDKYYVRVFSGVANFFELLGDKELPDLDLSAYDHTYNASTVNGLRSALDEVVYPNINQGLWTGDTLSARDFREFVPSVRVQTILATACTEHGYTLAGYTGNRYIPYSKGEEFFQTLPRGTTIRAESSSSQSRGIAAGATAENFEFDSVINDPFSDFTQVSPGVGLDYTTLNIGSGTFTTELTVDITADAGNSGDMVFQYGTYGTITLAPGENYAGTIRWTSDGTYFGFIKATGATGDTILMASGAVWEITEYRKLLASGDTVSTGGILPNLKVRDLFLQLATELNALIVVDPNALTVTFVRFDDIAALYPVATDWTNKLDYSDEPKIEFRLDGYAQSNYLRWAEGTEYDAGYKANQYNGEGTITISDTGLPKEQVLFTSKFTHSAISEGFDEKPAMMLIPRYSSTGGTYNAPDVTPNPRIVTLALNDSPAPSIQISGETTPGTQIEALEETFQDFITDNYSALVSALTKTKIAEVLVRLNAVDILELDFTRPVYLLNEYWFIREVKQWKANEPDSTIVKLLRL